MTNMDYLQVFGAIEDDLIVKALETPCPKYLYTTEKSQKKKQRIKRVVLIAAALSVLLGAATALAAGPLKGTWFANVLFGNGSSKAVAEKGISLLDIREDAPKKSPGHMVDFAQVQEMLGIDLLDSPLYTSREVSYRPLVPYEKLDPKGRRLGKGREIERVDLWFPSCVVYPDQKNKSISLTMVLFTGHATENTLLGFEGPDAAGQKKYSSSYRMQTLGAEAILYGVEWDHSRLTAAFAYNGIYYEFTGQNVSEEEMIQLLDSLE